MTQVKFPLRRKILFSLLLVLTTVASLITFIMAGFFHEDKRAYINDWISIAAVNTAEDCRNLLQNYRKGMELYGRVVMEDLTEDARLALLDQFFNDFPELVSIALISDGRRLEEAVDNNALEDVGLTSEEFRALAHVSIPVDRVLAGEIYLTNSTVLESFPTLTMAVPFSSSDTAEAAILSAVFRSEALLETGSQFPVFDVIIAAGDGSLLVHRDPKRLVKRAGAELDPAALAVRDRNQAGLTLEFLRDGVEMLGGYAAVDIGNVIVGAQIPKSAAYLASRNLLNRLVLVAFGLLMLAALFGLIWTHRITQPLDRLSRATRSIARGEFEIAVDVSSRDEIGALAGSFNQMAFELKVREDALQTAQSQLIQSEKMAAFGQLGAGIAHEVKNPLAGILGCAQLSLMDMDDREGLQENLGMIEKEAKRCREIIENLMKFARQEKATLQPTDVNPIIDDAAAIVRHQMELNGVRLIRDLEDDVAMIFGNANQLEQVLINLFINGQQAMDGNPGTITVSSRMADEDHVEIRVADSGPGIPEDIQTKLFEPFFSTKPAGKGTGLGLSVSFGIIRDHDGEISIESKPGDGATFVIRVPALSVKRTAAEETPVEALPVPALAAPAGSGPSPT